MIALLHERYDTRGGNGPRYVGMAHVRSDAGFDAKRTADFMALDLWPSKGLVLHGHEVKISRSDWLNELKDPEKSGAFLAHVDYWWLVIADAAMVKAGELPQQWGMMVPGSDGKLRVVKQAPRLHPPVITERGTVKQTPIHRGLVAAMLRSASKAANNLACRMADRALADFRASHTIATEEHAVMVYRNGGPDGVLLRTADLAAAKEGLAAAREQNLFPWIESKITYTYTKTDRIR